MAGTETLVATVVCMLTFSVVGHCLTANLFVTVYAVGAKTATNLGT